jgi:hypothetical protein
MVHVCVLVSLLLEQLCADPCCLLLLHAGGFFTLLVCCSHGSWQIIPPTTLANVFRFSCVSFSCPAVLLFCRRQQPFVVEMMNPLDDPELADTADRAARKIIENGWARIAQQLPEGQREQLFALRKKQDEGHLQAVLRAAEEQYRFEAQQEANQAGMSSRSGSVGFSGSASAAVASAAAGSSSRSSSSTAAAGSGSPSQSSQHVSAAGQRQAPGPVGGAKQWEKVHHSLAQVDEMFQRAQREDVDPRLPALCKTLHVGSITELSLYVALSTGIVSCRMGGRSGPLLGILANFLGQSDWDASLVPTLAQNVQALLAVLGHKAAGLVCGQDLLEHANTVLQLGQQGQLRIVDRAAAAAGAAAGASSSDAFCDPVLRLRGGGPGSSAASSDVGEGPCDGEGCSPGCEAAADALLAQDAEHSSPTAAAAATSTSYQASSSSSDATRPTALPDSVLQAYRSFVGIWKRWLPTGQWDLSRVEQQVSVASPAPEAAPQHLLKEFSPASLPKHFNSMTRQAAMQWVLLLLSVPHTGDSEATQIASRCAGLA